jgi:RimJ/RimL family protein N-acetyltransferase
MIHLEPMNETEFNAFLTGAIRDYAQDKVDAGNWDAAEALHKSATEFQNLLPNGVASPDQYLFTIKDETGTGVGMIWFAVEKSGPRPMAFIYDFLIHEPYRRRGYATEALSAVEDEVRALAIDTLGLHVFGHNTAARALYEKTGYVITNINMSKKLDPLSEA